MIKSKTAKKFVIQKNVEIPNRGSFRKSKYPWSGMNVGDSFFAPKSKLSTLAAAAAAAGKRHGMKFSLRTIDNGIRVWRVA